MFRDEALNTFTHEANETLQIEIDLSECLTINAVPCLSHMVTFADVRVEESELYEVENGFSLVDVWRI